MRKLTASLLLLLCVAASASVEHELFVGDAETLGIKGRGREMKTMRRIRGAFRGVCLAGLLTCDVALSQTIEWRQTGGPEGASVSAVVIDSHDEIFVGTDQGGIFWSADEGEHWTHAGLAGLGVKAVAINAQDHLFVGTWESGVWRSTDGGETWTLGNQGLPDSYPVGALTIDSEGRLFAGTGIDGEAPGSGIYRSTDNGSSWTFVSPDLEDVTVASLAAGTGGALFAGTLGHGVYRSTDAGDTWDHIGLTGLDVHGLTVGSDGDVYAATWCDLFHSADNGDHWTPVHAHCGQRSVAANSAGEVFVPVEQYVFRSADGGVSWRTDTIDLPDVRVHAMAFDSHGHFFSVGSGVFRSIDDGEQWVESQAGLIATEPDSIVFDSARCMLANGGGVSRSCDLGETWSYRAFRLHCVESLATSANGRVYAGVSGGCGAYPGTDGFEGGLFRSVDMGSSWTYVRGALSDVGIASIAVNSRGHVFAGSGGSPDRSKQGRIFRSTDNGESWVEVDTEALTTHVRWLAANGSDHLFAVALDEVEPGNGGPDDGVFRSTDEGESWVRLNHGSQDAIHALAIDRSNGHLFLAVARRGILRSTDNGDTWQVLSNAVPNLNLVVSLVAERGNLFAALAPGGVLWFQQDGTGINIGLSERNVLTVAIGPGGYLFAGTDANGVFRSVNPFDFASPPATRRRAVRH